MPKVEGVDKVMKAFERLAKKADEDGRASVTVGYTQQYAVFVHEDLAATHKEGKRAKFLEGPARQQAAVLAGIIRTAAKQGLPLIKGLLLAGLRLQRESQLIVPIDTGALKASAFTAPTDQVAEIAGAAYERSQAIKAAHETRKGAA
jgi:hypothetical protein